VSAPKTLISLAALVCALALPAVAQADFGIVPGSTTVTARNADGTIDTQAGSHPYSFTVHFDLNTEPDGSTQGGQMRDVFAKLPPGFFGNPQEMPTCPSQSFDNSVPLCRPASQVGVLHAIIPELKAEVIGPIYNLSAPPGKAARFGFNAVSFTSIQYASVRAEEGYGLGFSAPNVPIEVSSVTETFWGNPADPRHTP